MDETPKGWFVSLIMQDPLEQLSDERRIKRAKHEKVCVLAAPCRMMALTSWCSSLCSWSGSWPLSRLAYLDCASWNGSEAVGMLSLGSTGSRSLERALNTKVVGRRSMISSLC